MASSEIWMLDSEPVRSSARGGRNEPPLVDGEERPGGNLCIWGIPLILSVAGIVMIASLTLNSRHAGDTVKQFKLLCVGIMFMYICCMIPLSFMRRNSKYLWLLAMALVIATLIPGLGIKVNGASRWLSFLGRRFQPMEILTLGAPMFLADRLAATKREEWDCFYKPTLMIAVLSSLPLLLQPNMGGIVLVCAICVSMHVVGRGWKYPLIGGTLLAIVCLVLILITPYRMDRLLTFLDPWKDPLDSGFQSIQGRIAFSNGGIAGVGLWKGLQKLKYLPEAHTDYIFPAIGEEFGLTGTLFIVLLYAFWVYKVYRLYRRSPDPYISVLIWGLTVSVMCPMFINLGGVLNMLPLTGIPLPFLSSGGTSLIVMWVKIGVLMRVAIELTSREGRSWAEKY